VPGSTAFGLIFPEIPRPLPESAERETLKEMDSTAKKIHKKFQIVT